MRAPRWVLAAVVVALPAGRARGQGTEKTIQMTAEKFKFTPAVIHLKVGETIMLELTTLDRRHGFQVPEWKIDETIEPGKVTRVRLTADRAGTFAFHCDVFCGSGHEEMAGEVVVSP